MGRMRLRLYGMKVDSVELPSEVAKIVGDIGRPWSGGRNAAKENIFILEIIIFFHSQTVLSLPARLPVISSKRSPSSP